VEKLINTIQKEIDTSSQSALIGKTPDLTKILKEFNSKPIDQFSKVCDMLTNNLSLASRFLRLSQRTGSEL
jgi:hypothetical protein